MILKSVMFELVFQGLELTNSDGPVLYVKKADNVTLTFLDGTVSTLSDGEEYEINDSKSNLDGAVFSKSDLTLRGEGTLTVNGNCKHGIVSKDGLAIESGYINVTSAGAGIVGKDCVILSGGSINVTAGTDWIRSDNDEDSSPGYVTVNGAEISIVSGNDGIQAETLLSVEGGKITLNSGGGSANASTEEGRFNGGWGNCVGGSSSSDTSEESAKGLKAGKEIIISAEALLQIHRMILFTQMKT